MGDMGEIFQAMREHNNKVRQEKNEKFEPLLIEIGAEQKSGSVYMKDDWFCYPTKGFAMHKRTYQKVSLTEFIKRYKQNQNL